MAIDTALPKKQADGREILEDGDQIKIAHPMHCIEACAAPSETDALWRFLEASEFHRGFIQIVDDEGEPLGRYADYADRLDPQSYVRYEVSAYSWVRRFSLGKEWDALASVFLRMMTDRLEMSFVDWGSFLTNSDDQRISYGGAQVSMRMLGLRLRDSYRDYARFYATLKEEAEGGRELSPREVLREVDRNHAYKQWIDEFKSSRGLIPK